MNWQEETYKSRGLEPIPPWFTGRVPPGNAEGCSAWMKQFEFQGRHPIISHPDRSGHQMTEFQVGPQVW